MGIIPACAGNTVPAWALQSINGDHPRVCGEHRFAGSMFRQYRGSFPRVRGTRLASDTSPVLAVDHPRVCGEHKDGTDNTDGYPGSSPRVRGTLGRLPTGHVDDGIIPACAGNTGSEVSEGSAKRDHPRVCGEHHDAVFALFQATGSSPRVRGTRRRRAYTHRMDGIIPACAGNTHCSSFLRCLKGDHPRVCGEHMTRSATPLSRRGSSPRVRGTHSSITGLVLATGIIPACAGNTSRTRTRPPPTRDHPRVCGEHLITAPSLFDTGSSPRVRGTLLRAAARSP